MQFLSARAPSIAAGFLLLVASSDAVLADRRAAENQYRVARRLAAQRSPEAGAALRRVVELDPKGPIADDALLDLADLEGVPLIPEQLGGIDLDAARRALAVLEELLRDHPSGDRVTEARIHRALIKLEPLAIQDIAEARVDLLGIATMGDQDWSPLARYCVAWLDERQGKLGRARAAYGRLVLDAADRPVAVLSRVGLGRTAMRAGDFGDASRWLQEALVLGPPVDAGAAGLRELAVRGLLRSAGGVGWNASGAGRTETGVKNPGTLIRLAGGDRVVIDRKAARVLRFSADGRPVTEWPIDEIDALTADEFGRLFVATGDRILRLVDDKAVPAVSIAGTAPVEAMAVDSDGGFWLLERKGERLVRIDAAGQVAVMWEGRPERLLEIAWDGLRIVALEGRSERLMTIEPDGDTTVFNQLGFGKPVRISTDPAGQIAVLDTRHAQVVLVGPSGAVRDRVSTDALGIDRPAAIGLGLDGSLDVMSGSGGVLVSVQ